MFPVKPFMPLIPAVEPYLAEIQQLWNVEQIRRLEDDTIVAIGELAFTRAIYVGLERHGFERRYCYNDFEGAVHQFQALRTGDDVLTGYIATRPERPVNQDT